MSALITAFNSKWFSLPRDAKPDFTGRTLLITGANTGIGFEAALKIVECGAKRLIIGVRSVQKGEDAKVGIERRSGRKGVIDIWQVDMLDYASIQAFAARARNELESLDYAILNAGFIPATFEKSAYGWETTMQVDFISTVLLAILLLPKMKASKTATFTPTLEIIGSGTHKQSKLVPAFDDTAQDPLAVYSTQEVFGLAQYGISKLFLMYALPYLVELGQSSDGSGTAINVVVVCPGMTQSDLGRHYFEKFAFRILYAGIKFTLAKTAEQGARCYISALELGEKGNGAFYQYDKVQPPAALLVGEQAEKRQERVWKSLVAALRKDVPEIDEYL